MRKLHFVAYWLQILHGFVHAAARGYFKNGAWDKLDSIAELDLWPTKSSQFIPELKWVIVAHEAPPGDAEILHSWE